MWTVWHFHHVKARTPQKEYFEIWRCLLVKILVQVFDVHFRILMWRAKPTHSKIRLYRKKVAHSAQRLVFIGAFRLEIIL